MADFLQNYYFKKSEVIGMPEVKFVRQPGYLKDLLFIYRLHYNPELWQTVFCNEKNYEEEKKFYKGVLEEFLGFPDDFLIFFYMKGNTISFLSQEYLDHIPHDSIEEVFDFENFKKRLSDVDMLVKKMKRFYFSDEIADTENQNTYDLDKVIQESNYPGEIKYRLMAFFVNPDIYVQNLIHELDIKNALMTAYYAKHSQQLLELQEKFVYVEFWEVVKMWPNTHMVLDEEKPVYISFCLIHKSLYYQLSSCNLCVLGYDYKNAALSLIQKQKSVDLTEAGRILSDKNRITVLQFINESEQKERTTSEIAKKLGLSLNATIYHLSMMNKAGMTRSRDIGRTVYYRINGEYLEQLAEQLIAIKNNELWGGDTDE